MFHGPGGGFSKEPPGSRRQVVRQDEFEVLVGLIYTHPAEARFGLDRTGGIHVRIVTLDARPV